MLKSIHPASLFDPAGLTTGTGGVDVPKSEIEDMASRVNAVESCLAAVIVERGLRLRVTQQSLPFVKKTGLGE